MGTFRVAGEGFKKTDDRRAGQGRSTTRQAQIKDIVWRQANLPKQIDVIVDDLEA